MKPVLGLLSFLVLSVTAEARVFDFKKESIAPYFRGTGGLSAVGQEGFANAKGAATTLGDDEALFNYSGEFGVLFHLMETFNFRFAIEAIQAQEVADLKGNNSSGAELYTLESSTFVLHPNFAAEFIHTQSDSLRFFSYVGLGQANLTLENQYQMTTAGETAYVPSYTEKLEATSVSYFGGFGLEALMVDTTTVQVDLGYRYLKFKELKHKGDLTSIQGSFGKGDVARNDDGSKRRQDFSGFYLGISFRFYIEII